MKLKNFPNQTLKNTYVQDGGHTGALSLTPTRMHTHTHTHTQIKFAGLSFCSGDTLKFTNFSS